MNQIVCICLTLAGLSLSYTTLPSGAYPTTNNLEIFGSDGGDLSSHSMHLETSKADKLGGHKLGGASGHVSDAHAALEASGSMGSVMGNNGASVGAEHSFRQFISGSSNPESTLIGELKPNASSLEQMLLRNKIANTISLMQELDKQDQMMREQHNGGVVGPALQSHSLGDESSAHTHRADCYIEVTRVERVPGRCHKTGSGLPICQSDNYMTISNECK